MTDKIKHMMTRKEAILKLADNMVWLKSDAEKAIDFFIEAGMLEIKEEENIYSTDANRERFRSMLASLGHEEATVYGHWALAAYDLAFPSKQLLT